MTATVSTRVENVTLSDGVYFSRAERPYLDPRWQKELTEIGGIDLGGRPNFRIVWGGDHEHFVQPSEDDAGGWEPKYLCQQSVERMEIRYQETDGSWTIVGSPDEVPADKLCVKRPVLQFFGRPHWIIEHLDQGKYTTYWIIQGGNAKPPLFWGSYREIDNSVIDFIRRAVYYERTTTERQRQLDRISDAAKQMYAEAVEFYEKQQIRKEMAKSALTDKFARNRAYDLLNRLDTDRRIGANHD